MSLDLYFEENGDSNSPALVFLHGLLGSSRNWRSVSKSLSEEYHTLCFDLPNHGRSSHQQNFSVNEMADSIFLQLEEMGVSKFIICGHSLGGKVAMRMACDHEDSIEKLVVVDIAPRDYPPEHHIPTLDALIDLDLSSFSSRKEADIALREKISDWAFRQFLLTNLEEKEDALFWLPNLHGLRNSISSLSSNPLKNEQFLGPALFVCGGKSGFVRSEHHSQIIRFFPEAEIKTVANAGHDVHVEDRESFLSLVKRFLCRELRSV